MKSAFYIQFLVLICFSSVVYGQIEEDTLVIPSELTDTAVTTAAENTLRGVVKFSADTLDDLVDYSARDSIRLDNVNRLIFLYGNASIKYQTYSITADYIRVNLDSSTALAEQLPDSLKKVDAFDQLNAPEPEPEPEPELPLLYEDTIGLDTLNDPFALEDRRRQRMPVEKKERNEDGRPFFDDGTSQFTAQRLRYNFKTRKGKIYDVVTEESNMFIHGSETKFVSGGQDTNSVDYVYSQDVLLTTCNADHPHYGIRSRKQKIVPNRQVIVGPSNLEIAGVSTPLILPFGFFPISRGAKNGLIFPSNYEYSEEWGFGLRDIGYYFPLGEYIDLELTGDIYFNGSWGIRGKSQYRKRYSYSGSFDIGFSNRIGETIDAELGPIRDPVKSFKVNWSHRQDPRSRPNQTFSASVQMQTSGYDQLNYNDAARVLNSQYSSNVSFRKVFQGTPFTLSTNARASQNTRTGTMQFTLPDVNVSMRRIFPFQRKKTRSPEQKWYEKISLQYTGKFLNRIKTQDSLLFQQSLFKDAEYGANHSLNSSASFQVLRYFTVSPAVNYDESWYFKTIQKQFDPTLDLRIVDSIVNPLDSNDVTPVYDTLSFGEVLKDTINGFKPLREFSTSISLTTTIFGSLGVGRTKGWFRGLRHVIKPNISFSYSPDYTDPALGYVGYVQTDVRREEETPYSIFEGALFGSPPLTGQRMALGYSFTNILEAKVFSKRDSTEKKIKLFNTLSVNGSHNFVLDSLKWSTVNISGTTTFFKGLSRMNFSAVYDPYDQDKNGRRINQFYWKTKGKPLRFARAAVRLSTGLTVAQLKSLFKGDFEGVTNRSSGSRGVGGQSQDKGDEEKEESLTDLFSSFRLNHDLVMMWVMNNEGNTEMTVTTNSINTRGSFRLSPNWDINVGNIGYDFRSKRLTYPHFGFTRNLHCWEMGFNWAPQRGTYSFHIRVRQAPLNFIKIPYQKNRQDVRF